MKKAIILSVALLVLLSIGIQFFQPKKNLGERNDPAGLFQALSANDTIQSIFKTSCFDCHSNHTFYPWYGSVSPVSLFMSKHIEDGKRALNFSKWADYSKNKQISYLNKICKKVSNEEMPLKSYLLLHKKARLSEKDREMICEWVDKVGFYFL